MNVIPTFPEFVPFSSIDRATYEAFISHFEPYSDFGYTSLYAWSKRGDNLISQLNGNLVLSMQDYMSDKKMISFIGANKVDETVEALLSYAAQDPGHVNELYLIPEATASLISHPGVVIEEDRDNHDYILATTHFVELPGPEASHTRRKISLFERHHGADTFLQKIDLRDKKKQRAIKMLAYTWAFMGTEGSVTAHEELAAIERLLKDIDIINTGGSIHCLGLYAGKGLAGFCIYEVQADYAIVHFIKADLERAGAADYMMVQTMRHILNEHGITKVNHEQDLGIQGLRAAKERYCPVGFLKKYKVTVRTEPLGIYS